MITQSAILERKGWSKSLILRLLGEPDTRKKQPGRPNLICLYFFSRVMEVELSEDFVFAQDALNRRKQAAEKVVNTKVCKLMADIAKMSVKVQSVKQINLERLAVEAYNERHWESATTASTNSDSDFLNRLAVNYLRHELTLYDYAFETVAGKTGKSEGIVAIRTKVFDAIASAYPVYVDECKKQKAARCLYEA